MESNAPENEIQLSKSTYKLVKNEFIIQKRGRVMKALDGLCADKLDFCQRKGRHGCLPCPREE